MVDRDESEVLPIAVPVLLSISPDCHYAIRATTLRLVGELADWIDQHPDTLDLVLSFILNGLGIPPVATYAAKTVQNVCLKCKQRMAPHMDGLLQIICAADKLNISNDANLGLLKGATEVLTRMPPHEATAGILSLCSLHTTVLQQVRPYQIIFLLLGWIRQKRINHEMPLAMTILNLESFPPSSPRSLIIMQLNEDGNEAGSRGSMHDPCVWLDRLAAIFRSSIMELEAGQVHPCTPIVLELWPIISASCYKFKQNQRIVERTCRCGG